MIDDLIKNNNKNTEKFLILSKSVHDFRETNSLFICNMVTHKARKVLCEKVQVDATVRDSNLSTSQGTMYQKEIYNTLK